jgi:hypothetical protein
MNAMNIAQLIKTKQAQHPYRFLRDTGLALIISVAAIFAGMVITGNQFPTALPIFSIGMLLVAMSELGNHTFDEYKDKGSAYMWLMLPASVYEKWLSNFIMSFLIVPLVFIVVFTASTLVAKFLAMILGWPLTIGLFNPLSSDGWELLRGYWLLHPLFFFGAIYFKNRVILKTSAAMILVVILWIVFSVFMADWIISSQVESSTHLFIAHFDHAGPYEFGPFIIQGEELAFRSPALGTLIQTLVTVVYFSYFWGLSLLRFKELEL